MPLKNYMLLLNLQKVLMQALVIYLSKKCFIAYCLLIVVICYKKLWINCLGKYVYQNIWIINTIAFHIFLKLKLFSLICRTFSPYMYKVLRGFTHCLLFSPTPKNVNFVNGILRRLHPLPTYQFRKVASPTNCTAHNFRHFVLFFFIL